MSPRSKSSSKPIPWEKGKDFPSPPRTFEEEGGVGGSFGGAGGGRRGRGGVLDGGDGRVGSMGRGRRASSRGFSEGEGDWEKAQPL